MVFIPALFWILFALGGTQISTNIGGQKWIRRYIMPALAMLFIGLCGFVWWKIILTGGLMIGVLTCGYGDSASWLKRILVGIGYGICTAAIGLSIWNIITPIMFISLFLLSNNKTTANLFIHKIIEGSWGLFIGIQLAFNLMGFGWVW